MSSVLTKNQSRTFENSFTDSDGRPNIIIAKVRYDDQCGNGHNTFSITGDIYSTYRRPREAKIIRNGRTFYQESGGCIHDEIARHFPDLAPFLKYHLCSSDGPLHYIANTTFHAGNLDHSGHGPGDPIIERRLCIDGIPSGVDVRISRKEYDYFITHPDIDFKIYEIPHEKRNSYDYDFAPKYTLSPEVNEWHECGFDSLVEAQACLSLFKSGKVSYKNITVGHYTGKERDLAAARSSAIWPEATDEELSLSKQQLTKKLIARFPALMADFQKAVEWFGFTY